MLRYGLRLLDMKEQNTWNEIMNLVLYIESDTTEVHKDCWPLKDLLRKLHEVEHAISPRPAAWEPPEVPLHLTGDRRVKVE